MSEITKIPIIGKLYFALNIIGSFVLLIIMLTTCIDVVGRYLLSNPLHGATEITELGLAIVIFSGVPVVTWTGAHVIVDILDNFLGKFFIKVTNIISAIIISGALIIISHRIYELSIRSIKRGNITEFLGMPLGYLSIYISLMCFLTALGVLVIKIYESWLTINNNIKDK